MLGTRMDYFRGRAWVLISVIALSGCSDSGTDAGQEDLEVRPVLEDVGTKVIVGTYEDLAVKAVALSGAVAKFNSDPSSANLDLAKQAWKDARRPWEQSEGFLFGPVDTKGIDPSIDSWPVNKADLDAVLAGSATLNRDYVDKLEGTLKGFHTIEYLLFGQGNKKAAADFTVREKEYLLAVTASFRAATEELKKSWSPSGENFLSKFKDAGQASNLYQTQRAALQELVNGLVGICDEVANGKIADPFSQQDRSLEESQFSDNSINDFQDNIRSVQNVYLGAYGAQTGKGLSEFVASRNPTLDQRVKQEIDAAIQAIGEMTPSFGDAIFNNKGKVQAAQSAIQKVKSTLEADVLPLVAQ